MTTQKQCPMCRSIHTVEMDHQWEKLGNNWELSFIHRMQSSNQDLPKLEFIAPKEPDGKELCVTAEMNPENTAVAFKIFRRPIATGKAPAPAKAAGKVTRADMETHAAEIGLEVKKTWTDPQLAAAIAAHEGQ